MNFLLILDYVYTIPNWNSLYFINRSFYKFICSVLFLTQSSLYSILTNLSLNPVVPIVSNNHLLQSSLYSSHPINRSSHEPIVPFTNRPFHWSSLSLIVPVGNPFWWKNMWPTKEERRNNPLNSGHYFLTFFSKDSKILNGKRACLISSSPNNNTTLCWIRFWQ